MVLTIFTFTFSTIFSFTEVYFTSITSRDGVKILEPNRRRSANFHPSLKRMHCKRHHYFSNFIDIQNQTQILNRGFNTLLRTGTLIKRRAVQAEHSDRSPWYEKGKVFRLILFTERQHVRRNLEELIRSSRVQCWMSNCNMECWTRLLENECVCIIRRSRNHVEDRHCRPKQ